MCCRSRAVISYWFCPNWIHSSEQIPGNFNSGWLQAVPGLLWIDSRKISFHLSSLLDPDKNGGVGQFECEWKLDQEQRDKGKCRETWENEKGKRWTGTEWAESNNGKYTGIIKFRVWELLKGGLNGKKAELGWKGKVQGQPGWRRQRSSMLETTVLRGLWGDVHNPK